MVNRDKKVGIYIDLNLIFYTLTIVSEINSKNGNFDVILILKIKVLSLRIKERIEDLKVLNYLHYFQKQQEIEQNGMLVVLKKDI